MIQRKTETFSRIGKKIRDRLSNSKGMSIGELLVSVLIMLLSTSVLTSVVTLGMNQYLNTLSRSEANVLSSTMQSVMTNELAYTQYVKADAGAVTGFQSQNYTQTALETNSGAYMFSLEDGKVMIGGSVDSTVYNLKLLGDGSYPNGLGVKDLSVTYDNASHIFTVSYTIERNGKDILDQEFQIININNVTAVTE